mmetsp:Transcript_4768/g.30174  ORF Transcript_4768/g.30174 Transcript_4768/m.30174 type:complete len:268 (-) Transcript_4768:816-1619(-)
MQHACDVRRSSCTRGWQNAIDGSSHRTVGADGRRETARRGRTCVCGAGGDETTDVAKRRRPPLCAIGVDLGRKRTGLAVSRGGFAPRPLGVVHEPGWIALAQRIAHEAKKQEATHLVVGLPTAAPQQHTWHRPTNLEFSALADANNGVHTRDGGSSKGTSQASYCKKFAHCLAQQTRSAGFLVYLVDERYTSVDANTRMLHNGRKSAFIQDTLDAAAAAIILERYFENPDAAIPVGRAKKLAKEAQETSKENVSSPRRKSAADDIQR